FSDFPDCFKTFKTLCFYDYALILRQDYDVTSSLRRGALHIDTKPNHELIHYCLKNPPNKYTWADKVVPVSEGSPETTTEKYMENYKNVSQDIRAQLNAEAIERLKQGESINVQDLETNLYWEFGKFTSRDGESLESYYSRRSGTGSTLYMYMAQIQEVTPDAADDSGPIFDTEPLQKVQNNDHYNVFAIESEHPEQSKSVHDTYSIEQDEHNVIIDSLDMSYDREQIVQNDDDDDDDDDLVNEQKRLDGSIPYDQKYKSSKELFKIKRSVATIFDGVEQCKQTIAKRTYFGHIDPFIQNTIEANFCPVIQRINADLEKFHVCLKEEMVADLRYFSSLKLEVDSLKSQLETPKTQFLNEIDRLSREYYYADHMNAFLGVYTELDEVTNLQFIRQPNAFKSQRPSILGKPTIFSYSLERKDFSKSKSVTKNNVSNDFSKPVTAQILPQNKKSILKNINVLAPGMYKIHTKPTQTRTTQLPHDSRKTNKRVSFSTGVIPTTSISRPQLKSNPIEDRVMFKNSQGNKQEVENHHRNVKFSKNKTSVTTCNDSLNAKTSNVNFIYATCGKYMLNENHDICVLKSLNGVNSRTKMPMVVPVSSREPKRIVNQTVAKPLRRTVASESTNQKPRNTTRKLYECVSKACSRWYPKFTPPGYKWKPKSQIGNVNPNLIEIILFIIDSGCLKHITGNLKLLINFMEKFLGMVKFGNDQIAPILGHGDLVQGAVTIKRVYYVEGLNHNLFSVSQFCDANLEVAFWKSTCYICDLKGNDLLTGSRETDLYSITLEDTSSPNPICLMVKATSSQAWLWHRRLSHLNFDTINLLSKNDIVIGLPKLKFVKDHLCSSCELGKAKRKSFLTKTTPSSKRRLQLLHMDLCGPMPVESINGKKYVLAIVDDYSRYTLTHFLRSKDETPKVLIDFLRLVQKGLHAQVRTVRTDKGTEFLNKTLHAYFAAEGINHQTDGENLDKMKEKGDACIFVGYSTQSRAYRVFNKRTKVIMETIHVNFDELPHMASDHVSSDPVPQSQRTALEHDSLSPSPQFVSKSSAKTTVDAPNQPQQQHTTPLNTQTTTAPSCQVLSQAPTVTSTENINQAETIEENAQVENDEFVNIFCTPVQDRGETSSRHVDSSNMHTFYQPHSSEHRWTKDHPLEQVIRNPSQLVRTRRQLESDGEMCMFALTVSRTEPKNIKEAMADSAWIELMQEKLHQFDRLDVWELVDRPLCKNVINMKWL
nr:hypothetical protein [Tanacetum cinerariifolium]